MGKLKTEKIKGIKCEFFKKKYSNRLIGYKVKIEGKKQNWTENLGAKNKQKAIKKVKEFLNRYYDKNTGEFLFGSGKLQYGVVNNSGKIIEISE